MITKAERIEVNGFTWYWQEITTDGKLDGISLYDKDGEYVTEFSNYREMVFFLSSVIECGKGAVIIR